MPSELVEMPTPAPYIPDEAAGLIVAEWNKIFLAYCFSRGEGDPMQMIIRDSVLYPGDHMRGFLSWLPRQWVRFMDILEPNWRGWDQDYRARYRQIHHGAFVNWLWAEYAPEPRDGSASEPEKEKADDE